MLTKREFLAVSLPFLALASKQNALIDRLGVMCNLDPDEISARKVLDSARRAGFQRIQVKFSWTKVSGSYRKALPEWIRSAGLKTEALGIYVNCCVPDVVLMDARLEHMPQAIELAARLDCRCLVAWTGGYSANMAIADRRNWLPEAEDAICRFLSLYTPALERAGLVLALESYITLACPDAPSLRRVLNRLPACIGAVLDPPNLTPVARFVERDQVLSEMMATLRDRIAIVHMKDFLLNSAGDEYVLAAALEGEMNYPLFLKAVLTLPASTPLIAEHIDPSHFAQTRSRLLAAAVSINAH